MSLELAQIRSELNVLYLETHKYEAQVSFLTAERDMILKAQMEGANIDPYVQADLVKAEEKRQGLEDEILRLNKEWLMKVE